MNGTNVLQVSLGFCQIPKFVSFNLIQYFNIRYNNEIPSNKILKSELNNEITFYNFEL